MDRRAFVGTASLALLTFGPRGFVAVASVETIAVSADGRSWTAVHVTN